MVHRAVVGALIGVAVVAVVGVAEKPSGEARAASKAGPRVEFTSFRSLGISWPKGITAGPDGALWFTNGSSIGRITTAGKVTTFRDKGIGSPGAITAGRDGALWFTNGDSIGRITTRGAVTIYRDRSIRYLGEAIAAGPDGGLWFTMYDEEAMYNGDPRASGIGRITTAGKVTVFRGRTIEGPGGITAGRDGALWFTMFNYKWPYAGIGRITPNGSVTATSLNAGEVGGGGPSFGITVGPDRAIWFRHPRVDFDSIGRISTAGEVKMFRDRRIRGGLSDSMTSGPDGALWFTNDSSIGRITTRGVVSVYKDMSIKPSHEIAGIATGPDKAIWFTNPSGKSIGRLRIVSTS